MIRGLVLIDKPAGLTSHDVIARLRKIYGQKRIGHAGTLDPEATGLLVVALGNITRLLDHFQAKTKKYSGEVVFGIETDSYDSTGAVVSKVEVPSLDLGLLGRTIAGMHGEISQLPPVVSALKVDGKRLYQYHRESLAVEIKPRNIHINSLSFSQADEPNVIRIEVVCGAGTYIRSIAHDLGQALGVGAHLRNLRRLQSGSFSVDEARSIEDIGNDTTMHPASALRDFTVVGLGGSLVSRARDGSKVVLEGMTSDQVVLFDAGQGLLTEWGQLVGLYKRHSGDVYEPSVILPAIN